MYKYDISMLVPGIRNHNWETLYQHMHYGCKKYKWELIFCGPKQLPTKLQSIKNVKYVKDYGCPSRALQIASNFAEGKFITWASDDGHIYNDSIDRGMDLLFQNDPEKDIIGMRYCEGENHSGNEHTHPKHYSLVSTHPDLQAPGVDRNWIAPALMLLSNKYYKWLGGIDCRFDHVNMNLYDFAYRAQKNGSKVILTDFLFLNCNFDTGRTPENSEVIAAFFDNDRPLYWKVWEKNDRPIQIEENWEEADIVWKRKS